MRKIIISLLILFIIAAKGQNIPAALKQVAQNNPELQALKEEYKAKAFEVKRSNVPANPEVEYGYFPGNTSAIGTKKVFGIMQQIDFPTVYHKQSQVNEERLKALDLHYRVAEQEYILKAKKALLQYIYEQERLQAYMSRLQWTLNFREDMQQRFRKGDVSKLEINKAEMQVIRLRNQIREIENRLTRDSLKVVGLNGNKPIKNMATLTFPRQRVSDKDTLMKTYLDTHPKAVLFKHLTIVTQKQVALEKHAYLPDIKIGYESEQVMNDIHRGIKAGISIPLWGDKYSVKQAKTRSNAAELRVLAVENDLKKELEISWENWMSLSKAYIEFKQAIERYNNPSKMRKAYELGEISSIELFMELDYFYGLRDDLLKQKLALYEAQADLYSYEL